VAPVLLVWMLVCNRAGRRLAKGAAFVAGAVVSQVPLLALFVQSPLNVRFCVFDYNMLYRTVEWKGSWRQNFEVYISWIDSTTALLLLVFGVIGLLFVAFRAGWERRLRSEFYLCGWLALALIVHISTARPTFSRYYLLAVPFLAILAAAGFNWVGTRLYDPDRPLLPALALILLMVLAQGKSQYDSREDFTWRTFEIVSQKVAEVTPPHAALRADEQVYFLSKIRPPSGMELNDSHKLDFPPALARQYHLISGKELERRFKAGAFDTYQTCDDDSDIDFPALDKLYEHQAKADTCHVFWGARRVAETAAAPAPDSAPGPKK
jgi:hypothetical protein